jgi:hypothetical protein
MSAPATCADCSATVHPLEVFPGPRCLACWSVTPEANAPMSARQLAQMWGAR